MHRQREWCIRRNQPRVRLADPGMRACRKPDTPGNAAHRTVAAAVEKAADAAHGRPDGDRGRWPRRPSARTRRDACTRKAATQSARRECIHRRRFRLASSGRYRQRRESSPGARSRREPGADDSSQKQPGRDSVNNVRVNLLAARAAEPSPAPRNRPARSSHRSYGPSCSGQVSRIRLAAS